LSDYTYTFHSTYCTSYKSLKFHSELQFLNQPFFFFGNGYLVSLVLWVEQLWFDQTSFSPRLLLSHTACCTALPLESVMYCSTSGRVWLSWMLVAIIKKKLKTEANLYTILQLLSLTLFEKTPLDQLLTKTDLKGVIRKTSNQLSLFDNLTEH